MSGGGPESGLEGGGAMGALMRSRDWSATPLGEVSSWPQSLRTAMSLCLGMTFPVMIAWGPRLSMLYNDGYVPLLGRRRHPRALGQPLLECFDERRDRLVEVYGEILRGGPPYARSDVVLPVDRDGAVEEAAFDVNCSPIHDESGKAGGVLTLCIERRRAAPLSLLMQFSTPVCALRGPRHVVELANPACCEVWGTTPEAAMGRPLAEVLPEPERQRTVAVVEGVLRTGEAVTGPRARVVLGGRTVDFHFTYSPLRGSGGAVDGVLVAAFDVTDEVRAQEALAQTVRYNEMFAGILAHDLRSPLGAISTAAQLVQMRRPDDERIGPPLARILSSGARMVRMIDQLLDFTRIRLGGGLRLERQRVDLAELARAAIAEAESASPGWRARLETEGDAWGRWDADRLAQVLSNLAGNAAQHGGKDAPALVRLDGSESGRVTLTIENRGAIPRDLLPNLFDPFHTVPRVRSNVRGLGLGLFIAREIVSAHGGEVAVASSDDRGTRFTVTLPRDRGPA